MRKIARCRAPQHSMMRLFGQANDSYPGQLI